MYALERYSWYFYLSLWLPVTIILFTFVYPQSVFFRPQHYPNRRCLSSPSPPAPFQLSFPSISLHSPSSLHQLHDYLTLPSSLVQPEMSLLFLFYILWQHQHNPPQSQAASTRLAVARATAQRNIQQGQSSSRRHRLLSRSLSFSCPRNGRFTTLCHSTGTIQQRQNPGRRHRRLPQTPLPLLLGLPN